MSWKAEVQTASNGDDWDSNTLRFALQDDAYEYARDLASRWTAVTAWRVVASEEEANR